MCTKRLTLSHAAQKAVLLKKYYLRITWRVSRTEEFVCKTLAFRYARELRNENKMADGRRIYVLYELHNDFTGLKSYLYFYFLIGPLSKKRLRTALYGVRGR